MDAIVKSFSPGERSSEVMVSFGIKMRNQFSVNKAYRRSQELVWLEDLRQYKAIYDPDVKIDPNNSKAYPKLTRSKINMVLSRLVEMLFPETERNWEATPTPEPKVAKEIVMEIAGSLVQENPETGVPTFPTADELRLAIQTFSKEACEKMVNVIDDQLTEMDYAEETKHVLRSGLKFGTGIMKGPLIGKRTKRRWAPISNGEYQEEVESEDVPELKSVRIWDWYPELSVTEAAKMEGSYERHVMTKHDVRGLIIRDDFYGDIIKEYIKDHPEGDYVPLNWEVDLQVIEVEASSGGRDFGKSMTPSSDDDRRSSYRKTGKKYEVLEYWGYVDGSDLASCGVSVDDPTLEYGANIWVLGNRVIKAALYEGAVDQYNLFYFEKDETSLYGESLARVMRHSQLAIAAAARMVLDNGACVAGPQVEVNWNLLTPGSDITSFYPRKIWLREGRGVDAQYPAVRIMNIDSHIDELLKIIEAFKQFGDEETTLPTWMIGQMVNNETAQATSGRMSMITISIKDVVRNFDTFTERNIRALYDWNMEFNPRKDIKGDFACKARGVSSLVMKEIRMQALTQLTANMTDEEWDYIPKRDFLQEKLRSHDVNIRLLSEEEVSKLREERSQSMEMQLAIKMQEAEIGYKKAQTMAQLSRAKKANVDSIAAAQVSSEGGDPRKVEEELASQRMDTEGKVAAMQWDREKHEFELQKEAERFQSENRRQDEAHNLELLSKAVNTRTEIEIKRESAKAKKGKEGRHASKREKS